MRQSHWFPCSPIYTVVSMGCNLGYGVQKGTILNYTHDMDPSLIISLSVLVCTVPKISRLIWCTSSQNTFIVPWYFIKILTCSKNINPLPSCQWCLVWIKTCWAQFWHRLSFRTWNGLVSWAGIGTCSSPLWQHAERLGLTKYYPVPARQATFLVGNKNCQLELSNVRWYHFISV